MRRGKQLLTLFVSLVALTMFMHVSMIGNVDFYYFWGRRERRPLVENSDSPVPDSDLSRQESWTPSSVIQETTRTLYKDSKNLDFWLQQSAPKVYIYQTLPDHMSVKSVSQCINQRYNSEHQQQRATCGWYPTVCTENSTSSSPYYNVYRDNFNSDVFLIQRFLTYWHTTTDPFQADFFVVPYPHRSHCFCNNDNLAKMYSCSYSFKYIQEHVIQKLQYYNNSTKHRHLFILGSDFSLSNPPFRREVPFHLSTGPADGCRPNRHSKGQTHWSDVCGSFTVPYVNTDHNYQPTNMAQRSEYWWLARPRQYALVAFMGTPSQLSIRRQFMTNRSQLVGHEIGGLPIHIHDIGPRQRYLTDHEYVMQMYQNAIFCPILAGDDCGQKRFFDVVMSGCIPVVVSYAQSDEPTWPSWFKPRACSIRRSYPYSRGTFHGDNNAGIDFINFVVSVNGTCGLECMKSTLEEILKQPQELKRMRMGLRTFAQLFSYGIGNAADESVDMFSALIVTIRHYLASFREHH